MTGVGRILPESPRLSMSGRAADRFRRQSAPAAGTPSGELPSAGTGLEPTLPMTTGSP